MSLLVIQLTPYVLSLVVRVLQLLLNELLAELLFGARVRIARTAPSIVYMTAPDTDEATSALLPNHPGAIDYFQREQKTFMDRWGDLIWLALFGVGGASSALAWLARFMMRQTISLCAAGQ